MTRTRKTYFRAIPFCKNKMSDGAKTDFPPLREKCIGTLPSIKREAKTVVFEDAIDFLKGWRNPVKRIIVEESSPVSGRIADTIGRIGHDEIDGCRWHPLQNLDTVSVDNFVEKIISVNLLMFLSYVISHNDNPYFSPRSVLLTVAGLLVLSYESQKDFSGSALAHSLLSLPERSDEGVRESRRNGGNFFGGNPLAGGAEKISE